MKPQRTAHTPAAGPVYHFGEFTLDTRRAVLLKGETGIALRPKSFDVLRCLIEHQGQLVSKNDLFEAVWGQTVVSDGSITQCLIDIRRAIGDHEKEIVRTVPRRGYIFTAAVQEAGFRAPPEPGATPSRWHRWPAATLVVAATLAVAWLAAGMLTKTGSARRPAMPPYTIAVLPFTDIGPVAGREYLADGVADEILSLLSRSRELRVIARTSSFSFRDKNVDVARIARTLGADYLVEGSISGSATHVRVTAQLIDGATSTSLWSQTYERDLGDVFDVQNEIAAAVAGSLRVALVDGDHALAATPGNALAHERYLQAKFFQNRRGPGDLDRAEDYYREALDIAPRYAAAWAALAGTTFLKVMNFELSPDVGWPRMRRQLDRALELDPTLADAHMRAATYLYYNGDLAAARKEQDKALGLDPNNVLVLGALAGELAFAGRLDEAARMQQRAVARDPLNSIARRNLAVFLTGATRYDEARRAYRRALEIDPSFGPAYKVSLGYLLVLERRYGEALSATADSPPDAARYEVRAIACHGLGRDDESEEALAALIGVAGKTPPGEPIPDADRPSAALRVAEVYAQRGELDDAFYWLQNIRKEWERRPGSPPDWVLDVRVSPLLQPLEHDPRWPDLVRMDDERSMPEVPVELTDAGALSAS